MEAGPKTSTYANHMMMGPLKKACPKTFVAPHARQLSTSLLICILEIDLSLVK